MATYVGEYIANGNIDRAPDFLKTVLEGCKEALSSAMTGAFFGEESFQDPTNAVLQAGSKFLMVTGKAAEEIKDKLGYVIAVYLLTCYVGHYTYGEHGEKGDVYLSGVETVKDLLLDSVKAWFLGFVSDYCKSLFEKIGRVCGNIYKGLCQKQIREMSDLAGERAFGDGIRAGFREGFGTLSKESLEAARDASRSAIKESREIQDEIVKNTTDLLSSKGKELGEFVSKNVLDSAVLGEILRYKLAENETEREAFGTEDLKGAVYNYLTKLLGVKINKFFATVAEDYYAVKNLDLSEVTAGIEGGQIVLCVLGFRAEIDIAENIEALSASLFDYLFSWMNDLWKSAKSFAGYGSDPRDQVEEDPVKIKEDIEIRKNRLVHMEWRYEDYINSVTNKET